jgi:uncharacterized protein YacL
VFLFFLPFRAVGVGDEEGSATTDIILRVLGGAVLGLGGWLAGALIGDATGASRVFLWGVGGGGVGVVVGALFSPYLITIQGRAVQRVLRDTPPSRLIAGAAGLVVGLVIAALVSSPITRVAGWPGVWIPLALSALFGYAGVAIMVSRDWDLFPSWSQTGRGPRPDARSNGKIVLDTSAIIDGRIADISQTGFLHGTLIIPRFVLDELRHIADSSDSLRRNRGRRGLEMLNKLRKEATTPVQVSDVDRWDGMEVDSKLVKLAKSLGAFIVTTDFNLNRVAEIQDVRVLNVNELANAMKSVVLPGEDMQVRVIQEGKEVGQGVGFLDDGTMVVVENGRRYLDSVVEVTVTRVLQTAAGRLIFAQTRGR